MQNRRQVSGSVVDSEPGDTGSNPTVADVISSVHAYKVTVTANKKYFKINKYTENEPSLQT